MQISTPPHVRITPPPLPSSAADSVDDKRRQWLLVIAIVIGILLLGILIAWLLSNTTTGGGGGSSGSASTTLSVNDGPSISKSDKSPSSFGNIVGKSGAGESIVELPSSSSEPSDFAGIASAEIGNSTEPQSSEPVLRIYESSQPRVTPKAKSQPATPTTPSAVAKSPSGGKSGAGNGSEASDTGGRNPFIGDGPPAKTIVYVVDVSTSMQVPERLPRVIRALCRAIELLKDTQKFKVVLFADSFATDTIAKGLIYANQKNKDLVTKWLNNFGETGGTNPWPAMQFAMGLHPEKIILMSDGEFDPITVYEINLTNRQMKLPSRIDCAGMAEDSETLREIAKVNKGTYYQVN